MHPKLKGLLAGSTQYAQIIDPVAVSANCVNCQANLEALLSYKT